MKKIFYLLGLVAMFAITLACNDITPKIDLTENEYNFDITKFVAQNNFIIENKGTDALPVVVNAPFPCTILANGDLYDCDNTLRDQNKFSLAIGEVPTTRYNGKSGQYTREIATVFVKPLVLQLIKGYPAGAFEYPIRIRQYGVDGTIYLTAEQIRTWKEDSSTSTNWPGDNNQRYVLATVKNVSAKYATNGIMTNTELWKVPANSYNRLYYPTVTKPELEAMDMVLDVNGEELNVTVHQFACYKLFEGLKVKAGDTIEMNVPNSGLGVDANNPNTIWVSPQDIIVK